MQRHRIVNAGAYAFCSEELPEVVAVRCFDDVLVIDAFSVGAKGIGTGIYYPVPLHGHEAWLARGMPSYSLPESERYASENIALPMFAELTDGEVEYVISAVKDYFSARDR